MKEYDNRHFESACYHTRTLKKNHHNKTTILNQKLRLELEDF